MSKISPVVIWTRDKISINNFVTATGLPMRCSFSKYTRPRLNCVMQYNYADVNVKVHFYYKRLTVC